MSTYFKYLHNIHILDTYKPFRREVARYLDLMRTTDVGRILCKHINKRNAFMAILPYNPKVEGDPMNAYAQSDSWADAAPSGYMVWGEQTVMPGVKIPVPLGLGTGAGSSVWIKYHPATWREKRRRLGRLLPGAGPAEVLYHEMLHGYRMMCGKLRQDKISGYPEFDDLEEFYAILGANVYRTQRGFSVRRFSHHGFERIKAELDTEYVYYSVFSEEIDAWFDEQRDFCMAMARTGCKFNPFRIAAITRGLMQGSLTPMALP